MTTKVTPIKGILAYVCIPRPVENFNKDGYEWKATVITPDKAVVKLFKQEIKDAGFAVKTEFKEFDTAEALQRFQLDAIEGAGDEVWAITFKRSTKYGKGPEAKEVPELYRPKTLLQVGEELENITPSLDENGSLIEGSGKLVGNGSTGYVSFTLTPRGKTEANLYLQNVLVDNLIEYIPSQNSSADGSEFAAVAKVKPKASTEVAKVETKTAPKKAAKSPFDEE